MPKLMDVKMSVLDNDTIVVSVAYDGDIRATKTYGFAGWPEALEFLRNQTVPAITLAEVRQLIEKADKGGDGCPG